MTFESSNSSRDHPRTRLAIITSHPIQYYAPWFRHLSSHESLDLRVFYLFNPSENDSYDHGFQRNVQWDVPLLEGYASEFVPNTSAAPGAGRFWGLRNPGLVERVREYEPDAVLLIGYKYLSLVQFILAWKSNPAPILFRGDSHRIGQRNSIAGMLRGALIAYLFRKFSAFLYVGQANLRYFEQHGASRHKLFFAPHAVDMQHFDSGRNGVAEAGRAWRSHLGIDSDRLVVLFAGKFEPKKRPLDLVRAFKTLSHPNASLVLVGNGTLEGALHEEIAGCEHIHLVPFQNQSEMPRTYEACDLIVLPSYGAFETWGLVVNEAMSVGKPAVVSSHVGCAEDLVIPGRTGLVFEAGSVEALAAALAGAMESKGQLETWGLAAKHHVSEYSYEKATEGLLAALKSVCADACSDGSSLAPERRSGTF